MVVSVSGKQFKFKINSCKKLQLPTTQNAVIGQMIDIIIENLTVLKYSMIQAMDYEQTLYVFAFCDSPPYKQQQVIS